MNRHFRTFLPLLASPVLLLTLGGAGLFSPVGVTRCVAQEAPAGDDGAEVLTRGPVHEAFAETIVFKAAKVILAPKPPPDPIEETPPDQRPEGENVTWIPGYWAWDDEANEFLWVSGIWRNVPPGRQWVPGSWQETDGQYQWVSGYWGDAEKEEVEYLPEPPPSVEAGPNTPQPSEVSVWISGSWMYNEGYNDGFDDGQKEGYDEAQKEKEGYDEAQREKEGYDEGARQPRPKSRYRWQPGRWEEGQPDWDWVPAHYVWTRRGYIFVDGYWDYDVPRRGVLFAPVRFRNDFYAREGYRYRPLVVISTDAFLEHLFLRPRSRHYYFGDYYAPEYRRSGFFSSHTYFSTGQGYDPIFAHQRWLNREDRGWERKRDEDFRFFRDNRDERPPRTMAAFQQFEARPDRIRRSDPPMAASLAQFAAAKDNRIKFKPVNEDDRKKFENQGREIRDYGKQFAKNSGQASGKEKPDKTGKFEPARVKIPRSPVLAKLTDNPGRSDTPPKRPKVDVINDKNKHGNQPVDPRVRNPRGKDNEDQPGRQPKLDPGNPPKRDPKTDAGDKPKRDPKIDPGDKPKRDPRLEPGDNSKRDPKDDSGNKRKRDPRIDPGDMPKREPKTDAGEKPKRDPRLEPGDNSKRDPKDDSGDKRKREPRIDPGDMPKREPKTDAGDKPKRDPRFDPGDTPKRDPKDDSGDKRKREPRIDPGDMPKREPKIDPNDRPKREPKVEPRIVPNDPPKREPKIDPGDKPRREPKAEPRIDQPKREPRIEQPKPQPRIEPRPQPRVEPRSQPQPRIEPKPQPKVEPRPQPRVQPQPQPKVQPQPRVQPQPQPRVQPQPQPRVQPQPQPRVQPQPQPQPRIQPQPQPQPGVQPQPKKEDEDKKRRRPF